MRPTVWSIPDPGVESMSDIETTIHAYFEGINAERYDRVAALFAPDGVLIAPGIEPRRGAAEIEEYFGAALRIYPEHRDDATRIIVAGSTATVEIRFTGALESGVRMAFDAVDVFDFDDQGRIARLSSWYDSHAVRSQLRAALAGRTAGEAA
jgi:ketosteroid isomerase-like protein